MGGCFSTSESTVTAENVHRGMSTYGGYSAPVRAQHSFHTGTGDYGGYSIQSQPSVHYLSSGSTVHYRAMSTYGQYAGGNHSAATGYQAGYAGLR